MTDPQCGGELEISWERSASLDTDHYDIYRGNDPDGTFEKIGETRSLVYRDLNLENGKIYYYMVKAVDGAGNASDFTQRIGAIPTAKSDLALLEVMADPVVPAYGRSAKISARVTNLGFAKATGTVTFTLVEGENRVDIGTAEITLAQSGNGKRPLVDCSDGDFFSLGSVLPSVPVPVPMIWMRTTTKPCKPSG